MPARSAMENSSLGLRPARQIHCYGLPSPRLWKAHHQKLVSELQRDATCPGTFWRKAFGTCPEREDVMVGYSPLSFLFVVTAANLGIC